MLRWRLRNKGCPTIKYLMIPLKVGRYYRIRTGTQLGKVYVVVKIDRKLDLLRVRVVPEKRTRDWSISEAEKNDVPVHHIRMAHIIGRCT